MLSQQIQKKKKINIYYILIRSNFDLSYLNISTMRLLCQHYTKNFGHNNERIFEETLLHSSYMR